MVERRLPEPRIFTLEEATALLPTLRRLVADLRTARERLLTAEQELATRFHGGVRGNGHARPGGALHQLNATVDESQRQLRQAVSSIAELGCELKDPERGMVDFRTLREGRVVYLCWLIEEPRIMYWHELEAGYRGRQPL